jgi:hypothetical protein
MPPEIDKTSGCERILGDITQFGGAWKDAVRRAGFTSGVEGRKREEKNG